ncbi:hypothetical protein N7512_000380 [Penicillium capsulatum]|nr:hypothetical protein N7512_000380 [Penicillium capsulatum]
MGLMTHLVQPLVARVTEWVDDYNNPWMVHADFVEECARNDLQAIVTESIEDCCLMFFALALILSALLVILNSVHSIEDVPTPSNVLPTSAEHVVMGRASNLDSAHAVENQKSDPRPANRETPLEVPVLMTHYPHSLPLLPYGLRPHGSHERVLRPRHRRLHRVSEPETDRQELAREEDLVVTAAAPDASSQTVATVEDAGSQATEQPTTKEWVAEMAQPMTTTASQFAAAEDRVESATTNLVLPENKQAQQETTENDSLRDKVCIELSVVPQPQPIEQPEQLPMLQNHDFQQVLQQQEQQQQQRQEQQFEQQRQTMQPQQQLLQPQQESVPQQQLYPQEMDWVPTVTSDPDAMDLDVELDEDVKEARIILAQLDADLDSIMAIDAHASHLDGALVPTDNVADCRRVEFLGDACVSLAMPVNAGQSHRTPYVEQRRANPTISASNATARPSNLRGSPNTTAGLSIPRGNEAEQRRADLTSVTPDSTTRIPGLSLLPETATADPSNEHGTPNAIAGLSNSRGLVKAEPKEESPDPSSMSDKKLADLPDYVDEPVPSFERVETVPEEWLKSQGSKRKFSERPEPSAQTAAILARVAQLDVKRKVISNARGAKRKKPTACDWFDEEPDAAESRPKAKNARVAYGDRNANDIVGQANLPRSS